MESGGYIEQMEVEIIPRCDDGTCPPDSIFLELADVARMMHPVTGRDFNVSDEMKTMIEDSGFVDTVEHRFKLPLGTWSSDPRYQEIGALMERYFRTGIQGWMMAAMVRYFHVSNEACPVYHEC
jgi:hypothetical protein